MTENGGRIEISWRSEIREEYLAAIVDDVIEFATRCSVADDGAKAGDKQNFDVLRWRHGIF
ncbi:MAG TPA: hypothetical protein VG722_12645 [Tepidisphaeraceae bacterium]|nr:hypothetical protein [Tepidisphaeraceae bacterium]